MQFEKEVETLDLLFAVANKESTQGSWQQADELKSQSGEKGGCRAQLSCFYSSYIQWRMKNVHQLD